MPQNQETTTKCISNIFPLSKVTTIYKQNSHVMMMEDVK